ncbi:predicted protein [Scheffersomyces stipitis CBS 6054]|uniref:Uncharacterized protein n=1 Tax=Scheffersomyces stipitis (strain ATCC 58785 / CBS 6054 / NBRC 10063 / NRRL Y-11545) TaxID=322104 RepID=A3LSH9_PICST|nr:predicted protein [Scheffersomyces stipitis CBS 6054]ABN65908.2 predicted protein [Scheffersomyces stipitis CBS 6054]KAG2733732.1 hypothetical protein G9P44_003257 [Scheffersomyces stipitis]
MFGAVCSGRPIQLANQVEANKYVISIPQASGLSFIAIFLLPNSAFTDVNYTALVYFQLPDSQEYKLLGGLNPAKPSAIYRLNNTNAKAQKSIQNDDMDMNIEDSTADVNDTTTINIGISIETTAQAEQLIAQEKMKTSSALVPHLPESSQQPESTAALANKIVGHAYNYLGSFIDNAGKVPMKAFDSWWDKFKQKLATNPNFLDTLQN